MTAFWQGLMRKVMPPPGGIDCEGVLAQLYEYIDGDLDEATVKKIRKHLEKCKCCYPRYDFEKAFLRFLQRQGHVSAPPELRRKIFASLLEEESGG
jgi:anti-sigma factor (TIGR02949 family)